MNQSKFCAKCNQEKLITEFHKSKAEKTGYKSNCKSCRKIELALYREKHKETILQKKKIYRETHKHQIKNASIEYYNNNKKIISQKSKQYYIQNKNKIIQKNSIYYKLNQLKIKQYRQKNKFKLALLAKQWRLKNKTKITLYDKQWRATEIGKASVKANQQKRRAIKELVGGSYTGKQILELFDLQSGKCVYCKTKLNKSGKNKYHIDHIMPLSKSGNNSINNIQLLCSSCNLSKHAKLPEEFAQQFGMLI